MGDRSRLRASGRPSCALLVGAALFLIVLCSNAEAQISYGGQINITTVGRLFDDASLLQYSVPQHTSALVDGKVRSVSMSVNTLCCRTDAQLLQTANSSIGTLALMAHRLTPAENRRFVGTVLWIDGDVLVAQAGNPLCVSGETLANARALLERRAPPGERLYAPASPYDGSAVQLFGIPTTKADGSVGAYGRGVRIGAEQSLIGAVASDPNGIAGVAWSAARAGLAAGSVCEIPVNGVTASASTLRSGRYPVSIEATLVVSRAHPNIARWAISWYLNQYMRSATVRNLLKTADGRDRLLP